MKVLTVATKSEGYYDLLKLSCGQWGYDLHTLGWQEEWQGFAWKLALYIKALKNTPSEEIIICVDGYDTMAIAPADEIQQKFLATGHRVIFSGQRYFPNQKWIQKIADQVMSNDLSNTIKSRSADSTDYSRPCMGLLIAYAGDLLVLFEGLLNIENERHLNDDQTLLNIYYLQHPDSLELDTSCHIFQNLWRTRKGLYGKLSSKDKNSEITIYADPVTQSTRVLNKRFNTSACFLHAPFNLDMTMLLQELGIPAHIAENKSARSYWHYSLMHHISRAIKFYYRQLIDTLSLHKLK